MKAKLTKKRVERASYQGKQYKGGAWQRCFLWDSEVPGFGLRITPQGQKSFVFSYRAGIRSRLYCIGAVASWSVDDARKKARDLAREVDLGQDPLEERIRSRKQITVSELAEEYMARYALKHKRSAKTDRARLNKYVIPALGHRSVCDVTQNDVERMHARMGENTPVEANRVVSLLGKVFECAKGWGYLPEERPNPARRIKKFPEQERDVWVTPEAMPKLVGAIEAEQNPYVKGALWLYLLTGARKNELLQVQWKDVNLKTRTLVVPETKTGKPYTIPLSAQAVEILQGLPRIEGNPHVFPGRKPGGRLVNIDKSWRRIRKAAGMEHIRLHDLRRTVGSMMAGEGKSLHLISQVLHHKTSKITERYARVHADPEREMLEDHARHLMRVAGLSKPGEIVDIKEARGGK